MRRLFISIIALSFALQGCNGQKNEKKEQSEKNLPKTNIKVNKEYDKSGNLIRYDSTYSYYYSNLKNGTVNEDSIFDLFKSKFNQQYLFSNQPYFKDLFFEDSLLKYDFYKKDFFFNRFKDNMHKMDSLFWQMDVMKNDFYKHQIPQNINSKK